MMPIFLFQPTCIQFFKMLHLFILMLNISKCSSDNADITAQNHLKIVQAGDSVNFTCNFERDVRSSAVWVRQRVGEKPLTIVSSYQALDVRFENDFDKHNRFFATKDAGGFNLSITNTEESDTATYYCVKHFFTFTFGYGIDLIVKDAQQNMQSDHETAVIDPEDPEDSTLVLQCSVLTQSCAGEHNVYWFRRESGESLPGIIFTQERRNAQCERSSDVNSTEHKCIYNLPKRNFSHSDDGIYSCAVAACGEILFGDARKLDLPGFQTPWNTIALVLGTLNCLSVFVIIFLGTQLCMHRRKVVQDGTHGNIQIGHLMDEDRDALNYAALSFQQKTSTSRRPREKHTQ